MFVHSGAGLHGHGYSPRLPSSPPSDSTPMAPPARYPLLRSALLHRTSADSPSPTPPAQQRHQGDRPSSSSSLDESPSRSSLSSSRYRRSTGGIAKRGLAVRFREPHDVERAQTPLASDDESVAGSELSDATDASARRSQRKRAPRKSTQYALADPAPQLRTKRHRLVQIRPRLLLQLQQVGDRRAIPAFDVVPASLVAGTIIIPRLAKRFPRMFGAKPELGLDDVLVVRSDDYGPPAPASSPRPSSRSDADADDAASSDDDDADRIQDRDVLAVISALASEGGNSCAQIVLEDGSTWLATAVANGSFEFTHTDNQGCAKTARWARRRPAPARTGAGPTGSPAPQPPPSEPWWTFSLIDPTCRRHPVMGSLTADSLEVYDTYNTLSASSGRYPPSRPFSPELGGRVSPSASRREERATVAVTREDKSLMLATAAWIGLHQRSWPASANPKLPFRRSGSQRQPEDHSRSASGRRPLSFPAYDGDGRWTSNLRFSWPQQPENAGDAAATTTTTAAAAAAAPERAMSMGRAFMKRRSARGDADAAATAGLSREPSRRPDEHPDKGQQHETKAHSCARLRHWMQKLFRPKKGRPQWTKRASWSSTSWKRD